MDVKQLEYILRTVVLAYLLDDDAVFVSLCAAGMYYSSAIINDLSTERGSCSHRQKQRKTWNEYAEPIDDGSFRRMFRMTKSSFQKLCNIIENAVGEKKFKSQEYLNTHRIARTDKAIDYHGGRICGELKVAVTIRMLAGGSYLDLFSGHDVCYKSVYNMFHEVIAWINQSFTFILPQLLANKNENELNNISEAFARFSNGVFKGIIGAIDGLAIRIKAPSMFECIDPGSYFCRKQFYALNVQAIVDSYKRILWVSTGHPGCTHDSTAFSSTQLFKTLYELQDWLWERKLFLIGDSAYSLTSYMLTPFDNVSIVGESKDNFNYWHSNARIRVECAFGEIIMRWGIFWRTLKFDLDVHGRIINAAMLLHNFLIEERMQSQENIDDSYFNTFNFDFMMSESGSDELEDLTALVTDTDAPRVGGRPTNDQLQQREKGEQLRLDITYNLNAEGLVRLIDGGISRNSYGMLYVSSLN